MKTQYVANDGKVFTSKEEAEEYEKQLQAKDSERAKMEEEINALNEKIEKITAERDKLMDQYIELSESYIEKYGGAKERKLMKDMQDFFSFLR